MFARANALDLITYVYVRSISVAEQHAAMLRRQRRSVPTTSNFCRNFLSTFYIGVHLVKSNSKYSTSESFCFVFRENALRLHASLKPFFNNLI